MINIPTYKSVFSSRNELGTDISIYIYLLYNGYLFRDRENLLSGRNYPLIGYCIS